ncbi:hypothetical protein EMPS_01995 [Entomortierella parvispora]|uniref:Uncharacterized protein n=1 Tax=Entomortierella parvispora TaxID=205924 RepID=A0A9P3H4L4_9FUNG|nr:hypothetical protein EMPS_01995 [Entomortierella parvispora]
MAKKQADDIQEAILLKRKLAARSRSPSGDRRKPHHIASSVGSASSLESLLSEESDTDEDDDEGSRSPSEICLVRTMGKEGLTPRPVPHALRLWDKRPLELYAGLTWWKSFEHFVLETWDHIPWPSME